MELSLGQESKNWNLVGVTRTSGIMESHLKRIFHCETQERKRRGSSIMELTRAFRPPKGEKEPAYPVDARPLSQQTGGATNPTRTRPRTTQYPTPATQNAPHHTMPRKCD